MSFYSTFGRNRLIETIDGYDETVHDGPFQKYCGRYMSMDGPDEVFDMRLLNALICAPWIEIGRSRCAPQTFH